MSDTAVLYKALRDWFSGMKNVMVAFSGGADSAFTFTVLPRVPLMLLFWDADEDFEARASILFDSTAKDYLDIETTLFLTEAFVNLLIGKSFQDIVP